MCLGNDNRWYIAVPSDVIDLNAAALPQPEFSLLTIPEIEKVTPGILRKGDEITATISQRIANLAIPLLCEPEILKQEQRVEALSAQLSEHPLSQHKNRTQLLEKHQKRGMLREQLHQSQAKYQRHQARKSYYWEEFLSLIDILREFKALDGYTPTLLGQACAIIRGENELWLGLVLMSGELDELAPHHLAAAVSALITETLRPDTWANYLPSPEVIEAFHRENTFAQDVSLQEIRRQLYQAQRIRMLTIPVWLEDELMGLVEAWTLGAEWQDLCDNTSLDEGDLVRLLRRTVDVLWQIPQMKMLSPQLRVNAKTAIEQMKRFPL